MNRLQGKGFTVNVKPYFSCESSVRHGISSLFSSEKYKRNQVSFVVDVISALRVN